MLRLTLLVLLLANGGYWAWTHGWMASLGWVPQVQSEAFREKQQIRPEVLVVLPPSAATPDAAADTAPAPQPSSATPGASTAAAPVASAAPAGALAYETMNVSTPEAASAAMTALLAAAAPAAANEAQPAASPAAAPATPTTEPALCLQAGNFDAEHTERLRQAIAQLRLPAGEWQWQPTAIAGRWMVYLGKFPNEMALEKRRAELRTRKIAFDRAGGHLELGLSLGRFSNEESAQRELSKLTQQGIKGARVVVERPASTVHSVRIQGLPASARSALTPLNSLLGDKSWRDCDNT